jgi:hypothetical protein
MGEHVQQDAPGALSPAVVEALAAIRQHPRNSGSGGAPSAQPVKRAKLKPDKAVKAEDVAAFRTGFKATFGDAVGREVFSTIDRRVKGGKEILGAQVQSAGLAAMEMVSPLIRFAKQKEKADAELAQARKQSTTADAELADAEEDHADKRKTYDDIDDISKSLSTLRVEVDAAKEREEEADAASKAARKTVQEAETRANRAAELLAACQKSLSRSFEPGEDAVRLERERDEARALIERATGKLAEAERGLADADEDLKERQKSYDEVEGVGKEITAPGLTRELAESKVRRQKVQEALGAARVDLQEAQAELQDKEDGLAALRDGPALRRTQTLLDNVGGDPDLAALIERNKPSDFSGKAKKFLAPKNLLRKGVGFIPLVGLAVTYKEAVDCEDQERSLNGATKLLADTPIAKGLAESLSRSKEIEKWKKGFEFTAGFITTAVTLPFAGALGPAMEPITAPISGAVGHAATHVGGQMVGGLAAQGATMGVKKAVVKGAELGGGALFEQALPDELATERGSKVRQPEDLAMLQELEEGTAAPTIPGKDGEGFPLSDPPVAEALLEFLGPKADAAKLSNPRKRDAEERRMRLREEMFGTKPDVNLTKPMAASEEDQALIEELNQGTSGKKFPLAAKADKLRLFYIALGWIS